jgi:Rieske Fe-S protein
MFEQVAGQASRIRGVVTVTTLLALMLGVVAPAIAAQSATFAGAVVAPDGSIAQGFAIEFEDVTTGQRFQSEPTGSEGRYQVSVPTGAKYRPEAVVAPDGTKLEVAAVAPIPVLVAGMNRLDVQLTRGGKAAAPAGNDNKKKQGGVPWWKEGGPITGLVIGSIVFAGLVFLNVDDDHGENNNSASPSNP